MKLQWIEGNWKHSIGGALAGMCSVLGVLASLGARGIPVQFAFFLVPATLLIPRFVVEIHLDVKREKQ